MITTFVCCCKGTIPYVHTVSRTDLQVHLNLSEHFNFKKKVSLTSGKGTSSKACSLEKHEIFLNDVMNKMSWINNSRRTTPKVVDSFIDESSTIFFLDNICSHYQHMPWAQTLSVISYAMEPVVSSCHQYKIGTPFCIFIGNLLWQEKVLSL